MKTMCVHIHICLQNAQKISAHKENNKFSAKYFQFQNAYIFIFLIILYKTNKYACRGPRRHACIIQFEHLNIKNVCARAHKQNCSSSLTLWQAILYKQRAQYLFIFFCNKPKTKKPQSRKIHFAQAMSSSSPPPPPPKYYNTIKANIFCVSFMRCARAFKNIFNIKIFRQIDDLTACPYKWHFDLLAYWKIFKIFGMPAAAAAQCASVSGQVAAVFSRAAGQTFWTNSRLLCADIARTLFFFSGNSFEFISHKWQFL